MVIATLDAQAALDYPDFRSAGDRQQQHRPGPVAARPPALPKAGAPLSGSSMWRAWAVPRPAP
jgi:hypothetical protein